MIRLFYAFFNYWHSSMAEKTSQVSQAEAITLAQDAAQASLNYQQEAAPERTTAHLKSPIQPIRSWFNVGLMSLSHFMSDFYSGFLPVLLPVIASRYEISYSQSAAIYMVFSVAMNLCQPPIGIVADKCNLNYLMPLSILLSGLLAAFIIFSPNLWILMLVVLLCGLCSSCFHPISAGNLTRVLLPNRSGLGTSIYIAGGNLGFSIAPLCIGFVLDYFGESYLALLAIPAVITTILIYKQHLHTEALQQKASDVDGNLFKVIASKQFILLNTAIGLRSWTYCAFVVFIPLLFDAKGYSSFEGAVCLVAMLIGAVVGGLIGGAFTDRFGPKKVTLVSFIIALFTGCVFVHYSDMSLIALVCLFICGAGVYGSTPNAIVWTQRLLPNYAGFAASLTLGMSFGIGYICCLITGWFGDHFGLQESLLYTVAITMALAIFIIAVLHEPPANNEQRINQLKQDVAKEVTE